GLGLTVAGGGGSFPYRGRDEGIFVAKIVPGGAADAAGLKLDDEIISINGVYCSDLEHHQAVDLLRNSGGDLHVRVLRKITRLVESAVPLATNMGPLIRSRSSYHPMEEEGYLRPRTPPVRRMSNSYQVQSPITSVAPYHSSSVGLQHTSHLDSTGGVYVSGIIQGGVADRSGMLAVGDRIISINGLDVERARHKEVVTLLSRSKPYVQLEVERYPITPKSHVPIRTSQHIPISKPGRYPSPPPSPPPPPHRLSSSNFPLRPVSDVVIRKDMGTRLGLRIAGGKDSSCIPFGTDEPGIFISRVIPQGTAGRSGRLRIGDRLLKINGKEISDWTHHEVIRALSEPSQQIILTVRHDPQPEGLDELLIQRKDDEQFGIKIIGGVLEQDSYCGKKYDSGIFVYKVHRGGAIAKDGRVKEGMRLLEVNGTNVIGVTRREAIEAFRRAGHVLRLMVCDGWN
ncbi:hypothetical protein DAPPUDRAFT_30665, partial [Daphnia pulex]